MQSAQPEKGEEQRTSVTRVALAALLVLLALLLCSVSYFLFSLVRPAGSATDTTETKGITWVRSIYGWGDAPDQQLIQPTDVAVAPDGTIWTTDPTRYQVVGFGPDGSYRGVLNQGVPGSSKGAFVAPRAVDVDENGLIYVADYIGNKVYVMTADNKVVRSWEAPSPMEIAVRGNTVIVGTSYDGVGMLTPKGEMVKVIGPRGRGKDEFEGPQGLAIAKDGTFYVAEMHNKRLSGFSKDGTRLWTSVLPGIDSEGPSSEGTSVAQTPAGLTIDGAGRFVFVDSFDFSIGIVDPKTKKVQFKYGNYGTSDGKFLNPTGIDYDAERDWFVVADTSNSRVQIIRLPDSSAGLNIAAGAKRAISSPFAICAIPLILLILAAAILITSRRSQERDEEDATKEAGVGEDSPSSTS